MMGVRDQRPAAGGQGTEAKGVTGFRESGTGKENKTVNNIAITASPESGVKTFRDLRVLAEEHGAGRGDLSCVRGVSQTRDL